MDDYTPEQRSLIHLAIEAGRKEMRKRNGDALTFFREFWRAGGVQIPGKPISVDLQNRIATHVQHCLLNGKDDRHFQDEKEWMKPHVRREINRAFSESYRYSAWDHPDLSGFRIVVGDNVENIDQCNEFLNNHPTRLGVGVFPKDALPVLPPACDRHYDETVFKDELIPSDRLDKPKITPMRNLSLAHWQTRCQCGAPVSRNAEICGECGRVPRHDSPPIEASTQASLPKLVLSPDQAKIGKVLWNIAWVSIALWFLFSFLSPKPYQPPASVTPPIASTTPDLWQIQSWLERNLKDPDSLRWIDKGKYRVATHEETERTGAKYAWPAVYNAKNSYGGYTGGKRTTFYFDARGRLFGYQKDGDEVSFIVPPIAP